MFFQVTNNISTILQKSTNFLYFLEQYKSTVL